MTTLKRTALLLVAAALLGASAGPAMPVSSAPAVRTLDYFALGDSVAAGRGLDDRGGTCRRSPQAYPRRLLEALRARHGAVAFRFLACSGALAGGADARGLLSLRRQVDAVLQRMRGRPALVTLTIGINDFGWADIVRTYALLRDPNSAGFRALVASTATRVKNAVQAQLARLLARRNVVVLVTDYFNPVNRGSLLFGGPAPCADVALCYERTELVVHELNDALAEARRELGKPRRVRIASVHEAFHGHEAPRPSCGAASPDVADTWIQYRNDPDSNSFPAVPAIVEALTGEWRGDCFHPNARGAEAIARAVDQAARSLGR